MMADLEIADPLMTGGDVRMGANFERGEDTIGRCESRHGVVASYDVGAGVCSFVRGTAVNREIKEFLRELTFATTACDSLACINGDASRTITVRSFGTVSYNLQGMPSPPTITVLYNLLVGVVAVNDKPMFQQLAPKVVFTVGTPLATALPISPHLITKDDDAATLLRARITITGNYQQELDTLSLPRGTGAAAFAGISDFWKAAEGQLLLTGDAPKALYQQALRAVIFSSSHGAGGVAGGASENTMQKRSVLFQIDDAIYGWSEDQFWGRSVISLTTRDVGWNVTVGKSFSSEMGESANFVVRLINEPAAPMLCSVGSSMNAEATATPVFFVLTSGNWETGIPVQLTGISDGLADGDQDYNGIISVMVTQDVNYLQVLPYLVPLTNYDDPANALRVLIADTGVPCVTSEGGGEFTFSLRLSNWWTGFMPFHSVHVTATTTNSAEGMVISSISGAPSMSSQVTFLADSYGATKEITVRGIDDVMADGDRHFTVSLAAELIKYDRIGSVSDIKHILLPLQLAVPLVCTNQDNEKAELLLSGCPTRFTSETGLKCTFFVRLTSRPYRDVFVDVRTDNTNEGIVLDGTGQPASGNFFSLRIPAAEWSSQHPINIQGVDDTESDGPISYTVSFVSRSEDTAYNGTLNKVEAMVNEDNDIASLQIEERCTGDGCKVTADGQKWRTFRTSGLWVDETGTQRVSLFLSLPKQPMHPVTITVLSTRTEEATVSIASITIPNDGTFMQRREIVVAGIDDDLFDGDQTVSIELQTMSVDSEFDGVRWSFLVQNIDDDGLVLPPTTCNTTEAGGACSINVTLPRWFDNTFESVSVDVHNPSPDEISLTPSTLLFSKANWNVPQLVTFTGQDDEVADGNIPVAVTFAPTLTYSSGGQIVGSKLTSQFTFGVSNQDDDVAGLLVLKQAGPDLLDEKGTRSATFAVRLQSEPVQVVVVPVTRTNEFECSVTPNELSFHPWNWNQPQYATVRGLDDDTADGTVAYNVSVGPTQSGDANYVARRKLLAYATEDDDTAGLRVYHTTGNCTEWGNKAYLKLYLDSKPTAPVLFSVSSLDMTEGIASPSLLVLSPAQWDTGTDLEVMGQYDGIDDGDVGFAIKIAPMITQDTTYLTIPGAEITLVNKDEYANLASVTAQGWSEATGSSIECRTSEQGGRAKIAVGVPYWHEGPEQAFERITVELSSNNIAEGMFLDSHGASHQSQTVIFDAANWRQQQVLTVKGIDDTVVDGTKYGDHSTFNISMSGEVRYDSPRSPKNLQAKRLTTRVVCTNIDDDVPGIEFIKLDPACKTSETGKECTFSLRLTSYPEGGKVTIPLVSSMPTEGLILTPSPLVITEANWAETRLIVIQGQDDPTPDGLQSYTLTVGPTESLDPDYNAKMFTEQMENVDNDVVGMKIEQNGQTLAGIGMPVDETGSSVQFEVYLPRDPGFPVEVTVVSSDLTEGTVSPSKLTFTSQNFNLQQSVVVTGVDDNEVDGDTTFQVKLTTITKSVKYANLVWEFDMVCQDDDVVTVSRDTCVVTESGEQCRVGVKPSLWRSNFQSISVNVVSTNTAEGTVEVDGGGTSLSFSSDTWDSWKYFNVTGADDMKRDYDSSFEAKVEGILSYLRLNQPMQKDIMPARVAVTNMDNDVAGIVVVQQHGPRTFFNGTHNVTVDETWPIVTDEAGTVQQWFEVFLKTEPSAQVVVPIAILPNGITGRLEAIVIGDKELVFTSQNWALPQRVLLQGADDNVQDGNTTYIAQIGPTRSRDATGVLDPVYDGGKFSLTATGLNTDNDHIGIILNIQVDRIDAVNYFRNVTTEDGSVAGAVLMTLNSEPKDTVLFTVASTRPQEGQPSPNLIAFSPETWNLQQLITVKGVDDPYLDGDTLYEIEVRTLFTDDPDYGDPVSGMKIEKVTMVNMDDPFDRSVTECPLGFYGINPDCTPCPIGRFATTTQNTSQMEWGCIKCPPGLFGETEGGMYGKTEARVDATHPCQPCPKHSYNPVAAQSKCMQCPVSTPIAPAYCAVGSMYPLQMNWTTTVGQFEHAWEILSEAQFEGVWSLGPMTLEVNETSLQMLFLAVSMMVVCAIFCICQCINGCSKSQVVTNKAWESSKKWLQDMDKFTDQHARHIGGEEKDKKTIIGGFSTVLFALLSWTLCGVVIFIFLAYNDKIVQTLLPKTESEDRALVIIGAKVQLLGYTGPCRGTVNVAGCTCLDQNTKVTCQPGSIEVEWLGSGCDPISPNLRFEWKGDDANVVSNTGMYWQIWSSPVIPQESNSVNGTIKTKVTETGEEQVFRGSVDTLVMVKSIPAEYRNVVTKQALQGYRLQYEEEVLGSMVSNANYMSAATTNEVKVNLVLSSSNVMLNTNIAAKQSWLDVWSIAGGLFASIGATVVVGMNMVEYLQKMMGMWSGDRDLKKSLEDEANNKKGKKKESSEPADATPVPATEGGDEEVNKPKPIDEPGGATDTLATENPIQASTSAILAKRRKSRMAIDATHLPSLVQTKEDIDGHAVQRHRKHSMARRRQSRNLSMLAPPRSVTDPPRAADDDNSSMFGSSAASSVGGGMQIMRVRGGVARPDTMTPSASAKKAKKGSRMAAAEPEGDMRNLSRQALFGRNGGGNAGGAEHEEGASGARRSRSMKEGPSTSRDGDRRRSSASSRRSASPGAAKRDAQQKLSRQALLGRDCDSNAGDAELEVGSKKVRAAGGSKVLPIGKPSKPPRKRSVQTPNGSSKYSDDESVASFASSATSASAASNAFPPSKPRKRSAQSHSRAGPGDLSDGESVMSASTTASSSKSRSMPRKARKASYQAETAPVASDDESVVSFASSASNAFPGSSTAQKPPRKRSVQSSIAGSRDDSDGESVMSASTAASSSSRSKPRKRSEQPPRESSVGESAATGSSRGKSPRKRSVVQQNDATVAPSTATEDDARRDAARRALFDRDGDGAVGEEEFRRGAGQFTGARPARKKSVEPSERRGSDASAISSSSAGGRRRSETLRRQDTASTIDSMAESFGNEVQARRQSGVRKQRSERSPSAASPAAASDGARQARRDAARRALFDRDGDGDVGEEEFRRGAGQFGGARSVRKKSVEPSERRGSDASAISGASGPAARRTSSSSTGSRGDARRSSGASAGGGARPAGQRKARRKEGAPASSSGRRDRSADEIVKVTV